MGGGGNAAGSGATPAGTVACNYGPQFIEGKPTGAQGRLRPEHRKRRASTARSASRNCYREQRTVAVELHRSSAGKPCPCAWKFLWAVVAAETCLRRRNARLPGIICRRLQITVDMGGFDGQLAVRGEATEQDDMAPARAALRLLMPAPRRGVSIGYELAAAGVIRAAATRRACSAGPGVPCCLVRKMWCSVPVRVSASVPVSALAAILPSFCSASR